MKKAISMVLIATMVFSLAACGKSSANQPDHAIYIGGIGPITGLNAQYGMAVRNGAEIAVAEINAMQDEYKFAFLFEDDEADTEKTVNAYNSLKDWAKGHPFLLMGATTSGSTIAVAAETYADGVFQITPSGTDKNCVKYSNAFRTCFSDPNQGAISAQYIKENNLSNKVGVIYDSSDTYSNGVAKAFFKEAENQNLPILAKEAFTKDNKTDMKVQLQKMQSAGVDLVFLPIYYSEASIILKQANEMGYHPTFYGCDGIDGILNMDNFDTSLAEGLMFLTPFIPTAEDEKTQAFVKAYKEKHNTVPNQFAADAYDSIYAIYEACKQAKVTTDMSWQELCEKLKKAMLEISFDGLTGKQISWHEDGEPEKAPLVAEIVNGEYQLVEN